MNYHTYTRKKTKTKKAIPLLLRLYDYARIFMYSYMTLLATDTITTFNAKTDQCEH